MFRAFTDSPADEAAANFDVPARAPAVAIAVALKNEAYCLLPMLQALDRAAECFEGRVVVLLLANDCTDASVDLITSYHSRSAKIDCRVVSMLPGAPHANWARRLALDAAADRLTSDHDLLLSTDADTVVSLGWIVRTAVTIVQGYDAVAGYAPTGREERGQLDKRRSRQPADWRLLVTNEKVERRAA